MSTMAEPLEHHVSMVWQVAQTYRRRYGMVERDDIAQDLWVFLLERPNTVKRWTEEGKDGDRQMYRSLTNRAHRFCERAKAHVIGYEPEDVWYYSTAQLYSLLPDVLTEDWVPGGSGPSEDGPKGKSDPSVGGNYLAGVVDVRRALQALDEASFNILTLAFATAPPPDYSLVQMIHGGTDSSARSRVHRAIQKLQRQLGGPRPLEDEPDEEQYVGTRRAISNATAQAIIGHQIEE